MDPLDEVRDLWNRRASDWEIQVGDEGDDNRRLNSDPVLRRFLGDVEGLDVLDAGCGTGYLTRRLAERGARVVGVDLSERMIEIARGHSPDLDLRVDSVSELTTVPDASIDRIVSNYVLMDAPDLEGAARAFHRVLRPGGVAALVFSHPCFPQGRRTERPDGTQLYRWEAPYFERGRRVDPPWKHFEEEFVWFHRPLSDYFAAFRGVGFTIDAFEEPRLTPERAHLAPNEKERRDATTRPYSVAFRLVR